MSSAAPVRARRRAGFAHGTDGDARRGVETPGTDAEVSPGAKTSGTDGSVHAARRDSVLPLGTVGALGRSRQSPRFRGVSPGRRAAGQTAQSPRFRGVEVLGGRPPRQLIRREILPRGQEPGSQRAQGFSVRLDGIGRNGRRAGTRIAAPLAGNPESDARDAAVRIRQHDPAGAAAGCVPRPAQGRRDRGAKFRMLMVSSEP